VIDEAIEGPHPFKAGHSGMSCVEMVLVRGTDGYLHGDACGLPGAHTVHLVGPDHAVQLPLPFEIIEPVEDMELPGMWERSDFE
jgi:hypothetical protein